MHAMVQNRRERAFAPTVALHRWIRVARCASASRSSLAPGFAPASVAVSKGAGMDTAAEYRQRAITCLRLASESSEPYVKAALTELAVELSSLADSVETFGADEGRGKMS
jgi:hypothetical protein